MTLDGTNAQELPRMRTDADARAQARRMRDWQWQFAERVAAADPLWVCRWNKNCHHSEGSRPADLLVCGLIDGMELLEWLGTHPDWWEIGEWSDDRYAAPVRLAEVGRAALANRDTYDMEPVRWGLVEPGYQAAPLPRGSA